MCLVTSRQPFPKGFHKYFSSTKPQTDCELKVTLVAWWCSCHVFDYKLTGTNAEEWCYNIS